MKRVCCECGVIMGWIRPFEDQSVTSGYCPRCFRREMVHVAAHAFTRAVEECPNVNTRLWLALMLSRLAVGIACQRWIDALAAMGKRWADRLLRLRDALQAWWRFVGPSQGGAA